MPGACEHYAQRRDRRSTEESLAWVGVIFPTRIKGPGVYEGGGGLGRGGAAQKEREEQRRLRQGTPLKIAVQNMLRCPQKMYQSPVAMLPFT